MPQLANPNMSMRNILKTPMQVLHLVSLFIAIGTQMLQCIESCHVHTSFTNGSHER